MYEEEIKSAYKPRFITMRLRVNDYHDKCLRDIARFDSFSMSEAMRQMIKEKHREMFPEMYDEFGRCLYGQDD